MFPICIQRFSGIRKCGCVYVMEFKLNQSAEKAMQQITDKHYADSYLGGSQQVFRIGVNFAEETWTIDDWTIEEG